MNTQMSCIISNPTRFIDNGMGEEWGDGGFNKGMHMLIHCFHVCFLSGHPGSILIWVIHFVFIFKSIETIPFHDPSHRLKNEDKKLMTIFSKVKTTCGDTIWKSLNWVVNSSEKNWRLQPFWQQVYRYMYTEHVPHPQCFVFIHYIHQNRKHILFPQVNEPH